jgi:hypothetical protein
MFAQIVNAFISIFSTYPKTSQIQLNSSYTPSNMKYSISSVLLIVANYYFPQISAAYL